MVAVGAVSAVPARADRGPAPGGVHVESAAPPRILAGQHGWIRVTWRATTNVCDVRVTARGPGVTIAYPANFGSYSSLSGGSSLARGEVDYTALHASVAATAQGEIPLRLTVSYGWAAPGSSGGCSGARVTSSDVASLQIDQCAGPPFDQRTEAVTVNRAAPGWVHVYFRGCAPVLEGFRIAFTSPSGLQVGYPSGRASSGLAKGHTLDAGSEDYAAVYVNASALPTGTVRVPLSISWAGGTAKGALDIAVT